MMQTSSRLEGFISRLLQTRRRLVLEAFGWLIFAGAAALVFAFGVAADYAICFANGTAGFFLIVVLLYAWSNARFERLRYRKAVQWK